MGETEKVHPVRMRGGGLEYFIEGKCPLCGADVFRPRYGNEGDVFSDLEFFAPHQCPVPEPPVPASYPVDFGRISPEMAAGFRSMVEAQFGRPLRRFIGALKRPGLPLHFVGGWKPLLGHVQAFSKSDVHRPLDPGDALLGRVIPDLREHFPEKSGIRHRKH